MDKPFPKILYWRLRLHACPRTLERTNPRVSCKFMKVLGICYHHTFYVLFLRSIWTLAALIHLFSSSGRLKSTCLCYCELRPAVRKATSSPGLFPQKLREKPWGRGCGRGCAKGVFECPPFNDKHLWIVCGINVYQLYDVFKSQIFKSTGAYLMGSWKIPLSHDLTHMFYLSTRVSRPLNSCIWPFFGARDFPVGKIAATTLLLSLSSSSSLSLSLSLSTMSTSSPGLFP